MGGIENTVHLHAVDVEVWLNLIIGNVEHLLLHLRRIIEAVVWLQLEVLAFSLLCIRCLLYTSEMIVVALVENEADVACKGSFALVVEEFYLCLLYTSRCV